MSTSGHFLSLRADVPEDVKAEYERITLENERIARENAALSRSVVALKAANEKLAMLLALARKLKFAHSSEKWTFEDKQLALALNEAEASAPAPPVLDDTFRAKFQEETKLPDKTTSGKKPGRKAISVDLPRVEVTADLPADEKTCGCGRGLERFGEDVREQIDYVPAHLQVTRTIYPKYACPACKGLSDLDKPAVKSLPREPELMPRSNASVGLIAYIAVCKFMDHIPLYRLERVFSRLRLTLSRATMSLWMVTVGMKLARLTALMRSEMMAAEIIGADETTHKVLNERGRTNGQISYVWHFRALVRGRPILLYKYHPTRSGKVVRAFLHRKFRGKVQSDAYSAYNTLAQREGVELIGCWAHVRREFEEAWDRSPSPRAAEIIELIGDLYKVERALREKQADAVEILRMRGELSAPIFLNIKQIVEKAKEDVLPQSDLGKACAYAIKLWPRLETYLSDPAASIDNNLVENGIRPVVISRKNVMFFAGPRGAFASMAWYSLIQSAKANDLEVLAYLTYVLATLPRCRTRADYVALLPHRIDPALLS